jgi:hypothetical protein
MALHMRKCLNGLKQSSDDWYGTCQDFAIIIGFVASRVDRGLYVLLGKAQGVVVATVVLYVDDLLIIANEGWMGQIKDQMKKLYRLHDLRSVCFYLGINIELTQEHHTIDIHQQSYIRTILANYRMDKSRPVSTPMAMKLHRRKPAEVACEPTIYQSTVGSRMHTMTAILPNFAHAIGVLSRYNHNQSNEHMVALNCVYRYLNRRKDWRLGFGGALGGKVEGALRCYVDSNYAGCSDDYQSTSGQVSTFGGAVPVNYRCRILCLCSRLHETHTNLVSRERARHPD